MNTLPSANHRAEANFQALIGIKDQRQRRPRSHHLHRRYTPPIQEHKPLSCNISVEFKMSTFTNYPTYQFANNGANGPAALFNRQVSFFSSS